MHYTSSYIYSLYELLVLQTIIKDIYCSMNNIALKKLLMNIPNKLCRNMNNEFVKSILIDLEIDISQQHYMILKLLERDKHLYISEFFDTLSITKPQMTPLLDKLIIMGYVNRTNDVDDKRRVYISITKEGEKTYKISNAINNQLDNRLTILSQRELQTLENGMIILQKLCFNCNDKN